MIANRVERGRYLDSVALMRISRRVGALAGVEAAALMIGTPSNKALLREAGLLSADGERAEPNDLVIAVRAADADAALKAAVEMLAEKPVPSTERRAGSLRRALELEPQANLALISVPGEFAAAQARRALERGLNAMVFSDNVPIEEEVALKRYAKERGLLLMGPDCGTALIGGAPLAFANAVPRGDIGIVSASGTGLQEVSSLIARMGGGVSHGIGVGGRDLDERVGALGMLSALELLEADPGRLAIESTDVLWFAALTKAMGEERGLAYFRRLAAMKPTIRNGHILAAQLVASGEIPLLVTAYNNNMETLKKAGAPVDWKPLAPAFGQASAIGLARDSRRPHAALLFTEFLLSRDGQEFFKSVNRVPSSLAVETPLNKFPHEIIDPAIALDEGDKWDKLWSNLFLGGRPVERDE